MENPEQTVLGPKGYPVGRERSTKPLKGCCLKTRRGQETAQYCQAIQDKGGERAKRGPRKPNKQAAQTGDLAGLRQRRRGAVHGRRLAEGPFTTQQQKHPAYQRKEGWLSSPHSQFHFPDVNCRSLLAPLEKKQKNLYFSPMFQSSFLKVVSRSSQGSAM